LHTAANIKARLAIGKPVICNFPVDLKRVKHPELFCYIPNDEIKPSALVEYSRAYFGDRKIKEEEIFLIIDEAQLLFNAREWQAVNASGWISFFTQHRKYGYHVILIAQFDRMIDRQIRSLIEYEFIHRKVSNFGWFGKIMSSIALGKLFVSVQMWYPLKEKVGSEFFVARPGLYRLYDTYAEFAGKRPRGVVGSGAIPTPRDDAPKKEESA
jgi:hypothetical protein